MNKKNNKSAYLIIITIITVVCIIAGVGINLWGWGFMGKSKSVRNNHFIKRIPGVTFTTKGYSGAYLEDEVTLNSFSSIDMSVTLGDVEIKEGDDFRLKYYIPVELEPEFNVENGKFEFYEKENINLGIGDNYGDVYVRLTVPKGTDLETVVVENSMGDITLKNINIDTLSIYESMGNIEIKDLDCTSIEVENSMGDITIKDITFNTCDSEMSMGSVYVVDVKGKTFKCENSMGSIDYSGEIENFDVYCSMGSIDVNTSSDWKGNLETSMGDVTVNGKDQGDRCVR